MHERTDMDHTVLPANYTMPVYTDKAYFTFLLYWEPYVTIFGFALCLSFQFEIGL